MFCQTKEPFQAPYTRRQFSCPAQCLFSPHPYTGYPHLATETYLPIRVIAPVRVACQSHSSSICISPCCTQDKVPCPATPCTPGHSEEDLEKMTIVTLKTCNVSMFKQGPNPHPTILPPGTSTWQPKPWSRQKMGDSGAPDSELQKLP